jgi:hypothetical protein
MTNDYDAQIKNKKRENDKKKNCHFLFARDNEGSSKGGKKTSGCLCL